METDDRDTGSMTEASTEAATLNDAVETEVGGGLKDSRRHEVTVQQEKVDANRHASSSVDPEKSEALDPDTQDAIAPASDGQQADPEEAKRQNDDDIEEDEEEDDTNTLSHAESRITRPTSLLGETIFIAIICSGQLFTQAGLAVSVAPVHIIGRSLGTSSPGQLSWFTAGYSLTVGTFILIAGRLGDVLGHKRLFVLGFAWFALWSVVAGLAVYGGGVVLFAFSRAMQGIGPAMILPNALAILGRSYEHGPRQAMVFSLFGATAPGGFFIGAVFSSLLSELAWWPWSYWVLAFVCLLVALAGFFVIPPAPGLHTKGSSESIWTKIDIVGSVTGVAALVLFNFAWNQAPVVGWSEPYVYVTLILGMLLFALFAFVERRVAHPLLPFGTLKITSLYALACIAGGWSSFGIFVVYSWNYMELIRNQAPLLMAAEFSIIAVSGFVAAVVTGQLLSRLPASVIMLMATLAFLIGSILFATLPASHSFWAQFIFALIIMPWGMDMSFPAGTILLSRAMPRKSQGLAGSLVSTVVNYSVSIGLGFAGTVEYKVNDGGKDILAGFHGAWYTGIGLAGLGVVVALSFCFADWRIRRRGGA